MGRKGKLFVISAPSGSGKTTLCEMLLQSLSGKSAGPPPHQNARRAGKRRLVRSVSATTRKPREGEREGEDYFFISTQEFIKRRKAHQLLEWARVLGNYYGTPRDFVEKHINRGRDVLLSIDVQGARKIKRKVSEAVFIFVLPPSLRELEERLRRRSTEGRREIARRLRLAKREMGCKNEYNYVVLNDKIGRALARLKEIIQHERKK